MLTERWSIDKEKPAQDVIVAAARKLADGDIVAFPTETVYGLGALATNPDAVAKIFAAKERPPVNPLIIHIANLEQACPLVQGWPETAVKLAQAFWPGPLTIILPATELVPDIVRAGGKGVGIRMPAHSVALALIAASGPLAAPSANRSGRPSPRTADEVWEDLAGRIPLLLDAGATPGGLESTVLDLTAEVPRIIRPGGVPREQIEACLGVRIEITANQSPAAALPHYQVSTQVLLTTQSELSTVIKGLLGKKTALITNINPNRDIVASVSTIYGLDTAGEFYSRLRQAEKEQVEALIVVRDGGLPWDEAMEHRITSAMQSSDK